MNFRGRKGAELPQFQFTPMIDVVFLLLCFFITTSVFSQWEYEVDVVLPTAQTGKLPDRLPGEIIINVSREGRIVINQQVMSAEQLQAATDFPAACRQRTAVAVLAEADVGKGAGQLTLIVDTR